MPYSATPRRQSSRHPRSLFDAAKKENEDSGGSRSQSTPKKQKHKKGKKYTFAIFPTAPVLRHRPRAFLTAQKNALEVVQSKMKEWRKKNNKECRIKVLQELASVENELLKRLGMARNLKLDPEDDDNYDQLVSRTDRLIWKMEQQVLELQQLHTAKKKELDDEREVLKTKHNNVFVCCNFCEKGQYKNSQDFKKSN